MEIEIEIGLGICVSVCLLRLIECVSSMYGIGEKKDIARNYG